MSKNETLEALRVELEEQLMKNLALEQEILSPTRDKFERPMFVLMQEMQDAFYKTFELQIQIKKLIVETTPKKSFIKKILRKN